VRRFVEKPDAARARRLIADPAWLWNSGMLVAPAARLLAECEARASGLWRVLGPRLVRIAAGAAPGRRGLRDAYRELVPVSFDVAVLERSPRVYAVRGRFPWSDLGSWNALLRQLPREGGNAVRGPGLAANIGSTRNVVWNAGGRAIALLGVEGLVIVDMPDALLVARLDRAQDVRRIVDQLGRRGRVDLT
jgi:mannose-1-phosphate guanylyltransferase